MLSRITRSEVLIIQDTWDMFAPPAASKDLLSRLGSHGISLFYDHVLLVDRTTMPFGHVLDTEGSNGTLTLAYLIANLSTEPQIYIPYSTDPMRAKTEVSLAM